MHRKRLQKLAACLRELPSKKFDLNTLADSVGDDHKCNSCACALGWLPTFFPNSGLYLNKEGICLITLQHKDYQDCDYSVGQKFFELDNFCTSSYLFDPSFYPGSKTAKTVARRIDLLLEKGEEEFDVLIKNMKRDYEYII